jgi:hypothetical protein
LAEKPPFAADFSRFAGFAPISRDQAAAIPELAGRLGHTREGVVLGLGPRPGGLRRNAKTPAARTTRVSAQNAR